MIVGTGDKQRVGVWWRDQLVPDVWSRAEPGAAPTGLGQPGCALGWLCECGEVAEPSGTLFSFPLRMGIILALSEVVVRLNEMLHEMLLA